MHVYIAVNDKNKNTTLELIAKINLGFYIKYIVSTLINTFKYFILYYFNVKEAIILIIHLLIFSKD